MTFWDKLKPTVRAPQATAVDLSPDMRTVSLVWDDGKATAVSARALRQYCPCAECVEEWTGKRTYEVDQVPSHTAFAEMTYVGNYAISFRFSDGHQTGIYNWGFLRQMSEKHPAA